MTSLSKYNRALIFFLICARWTTPPPVSSKITSWVIKHDPLCDVVPGTPYTHTHTHTHTHTRVRLCASAHGGDTAFHSTPGFKGEVSECFSR